MKAAFFTALRTIEIRDVPEPRLSGVEDVLVAVERVGVCGSDVHYYLDGRIGDQVIDFPATLGHECAGTVVEVGAAVTHLRPGERVAIDPALVCGQCDQCRAGRENTCRRLRFMGGPGEAPGAAAQRYVLPAANCFAVPTSLSLEAAAAVEPLSIGLYAVRLAGLEPGARAAVIGCGPIGLSVLLALRATAVPARVYATDLLPERLAAAERCGATWTGNVRQDDVTAAITRAEPLGLEAVFECSGDPAILDAAQRLLAPGGQLVLVGIPPTDQVAFSIHTMRRRELTFKNVRRQRGCIAPVIELITAGRIDPTPLLTHRFPLVRISEAFQTVAEYRDGVIKAIVDMTADP